MPATVTGKLQKYLMRQTMAQQQPFAKPLSCAVKMLREPLGWLTIVAAGLALR